MFSMNDKISIRQMQVLLILDIFGTGVIILPRVVAEYAKQDGWILIILSIALGLIYAFVITSLCGIYPNKTFVELCETIVGKFLAHIIAVIFSIKLILSVAFEIRYFGEIISQTMLAETPFHIICLTMLFVSAYAAMKGYETRARIAELLIFLILVPIVIVFFIASLDVNYTNLLPIAKTANTDYLKGAYITSFAFSGIDIAMIATPYIVKPEKMKKAVSQVVVILGLLFLLITLITIARFGPFEITKQMWPVLEMMDTINIPGSFIERQEALVMSFWIISVFAMVNAGLFFSSLILKDTLKKGKHSYYILLCLPIIFVISYSPKDIFQVGRYLSYLNSTLGIGFLLIIPLVLLIIAKIRKLGVKIEKNK